MSEENVETEELVQTESQDSIDNDQNDEVDSKNIEKSIRLSGLMGTKLGMTHSIMDDGRVIPTTLVQLGPCYALEKSLKSKKTSLKVGYLDIKPTSLNKPKLSYFSKLKVKPVKYIKEFDLLEDVEIQPGTEIKADIFKEGDKTDVTSNSKGKGFAGVIKRHNFAGLRHTHGTPQNQRSGGSIGACAYPGRVWKGQKMAGRYGGKKSTIQGLEVLKVDLEKNLIFIKGSIPGSNGSLVYVNHTRKGNGLTNN
tara:strand:+ start:87031 stop:87786 length:756 start_codon:yes stop_codon:yes gene_type:complete